MDDTRARDNSSVSAMGLSSAHTLGFSRTLRAANAQLSFSLLLPSPSMVTGVSRGVVDSLSGRWSYIVKRTRDRRVYYVTAERERRPHNRSKHARASWPGADAIRRRFSGASWLTDAKYSGLIGARIGLVYWMSQTYRKLVLDRPSDDNEHLISRDFANWDWN